MASLKTVEKKVRAALEDYPDTRDDDMKLFLTVARTCIYETRGVGIFPLEDIINNYRAYGIPCFESVRRTRQKIVEKHPELGCSPEVRRARGRAQAMYRKYAMEGR